MSVRYPLSLLVFFLIGSPLAATDSAPQDDRAAPVIQRLLAASKSAKESFRPVVEADLAGARAELTVALRRLEERLTADGANGEAWAEYLKLDGLREQVSRADVNLEALETSYRKFNTGQYGLNRVWFADVRDAILQYIQVARAKDTADLQQKYSQYVETLGSHLRGYAEKPNTEQAIQIGEAVGWLESIGQAPGLVATVREELARPNLFVAASRRLAVGGIEEPVDETEPVRDVILGTQLFGAGHTLGEVSATFVPNEDHAVLDITYLGVTRTRNTGYNGPVVILSHGTTGIGAVKRLWVNSSGLHSHPARANAKTRSEILSIEPRRGGRLVERIAWRKAMEQKHLAEAIASQRAASRASARMDVRAKPLLQKANHGFEHRFRRPMVERRLFPSSLQLGSGEDGVHVQWRQAGPAQLAAPNDPPAVVERADLAVRIHESMINNAARNTLTGLNMSDSEFRMAVVEVLGRLPERLEPVPGDEPWSISFDRSRPVEVRFADGGLEIAIRGRRYTSGDQPHPGMNVSARYKIVHDESGFRAVREGGVEVVPPGLTGDQRVGTRHQIIRTLLIRRFEPIFAEEFRLEALELPGKWDQLGAMPVVQFESDNGWLTIAWRLPGE